MDMTEKTLTSQEIYKGRIIHSGDKSLALRLEKEGYDWLINEYDR